MTTYRIVRADPAPLRDAYTPDQLPEAIAALRQLRREHGTDAYVLVEIVATDKLGFVESGRLVDVRDVAPVVDRSGLVLVRDVVADDA